jgi:hypothetical protein
MKYMVFWRPSAEQKLADLWMTAPDKEGVAHAADTIGAMLAQDPESVGESRSGNARVLIVEPLAVYYEVQAADRSVWVFSVWRRG